MFFFSIFQKRELDKIYISNALRSVAMSLVSIYIPIYLLSLGYSLLETIFFYAVYHLAGLILAFAILIPFINKFGLIRTIKLHYPLLILFFILLNFLPFYNLPIYLLAALGGLANFAYYIPVNILFLKHVNKNQIAKDLSFLFALPKIFGIAGPLLGAILIPFVGFWIVFLLSAVGLIISFLPLAKIDEKIPHLDISVSKIFSKIKKRKGLFFLEGLDNIMEESEWFWGIFVFLLIGSLSVPGIIGGLQSLGGALFIILVGKYADKKPFKMILLSSLAMVMVWLAMMFAQGLVFAYAISVAISFVMSAFLISYTGTIYKNIKDDKEEEFMVLREIPTVLGRLVVFGFIILTLSNLRNFFFLPLVITIILAGVLLFKRARGKFKE